MRTARREDALDRPGNGEGRRDQPSQRAADLGGAWPEAAPGAHLQAVERSEVCRQGAGLYIDPPEHALVLSVDEKSQIQALDRTQPGLPLKKGRAGTMTHDLYEDLSVKG
jgi:hypothetical protein